MKRYTIGKTEYRVLGDMSVQEFFNDLETGYIKPTRDTIIYTNGDGGTIAPIGRLGYFTGASENRFTILVGYSRDKLPEKDNAYGEWYVSLESEGFVMILEKASERVKLERSALVEDYKKTLKVMTTKKIAIEVKKENGDIKLTIKIPTELETFFKKISNGKTAVSETWKDEEGNGKKFYVLTKEYEEIEKKIGGYVFNDYGNGLIKNDMINLAPLRTEGAGNGITITSGKFVSLANIDFETYVRELGVVVKKLWESVIAENEIKAVISFEI